jgi:integrase
MVFLSREDFNRILAEIPERWKPFTRFLVVSGARFGEASALRPSDVDRDHNTVRIRRAFKRTYAKGGYELGPTKTRKSNRDISVDSTVLNALDYTQEWLFTTRSGDPVRVSNFRANVWWPAVARAKVAPRPRVHDLRHTCASWLIQSGQPLPVIQQHLGHESIEVTVGVYGHLDRRSADAAASVLAGILAPQELEAR